MSEVAMAEVSMVTCLLDMPYEILFEILRSLSKSKLIEISKLCSQLRNVAGDARFWKDVYIEYEPCKKPSSRVFAFEELYSEPWPVDAIDLSNTKIKRPVSSKIDQIVKVTKLNLSSVISENFVATEAILAKYQCTELYIDSHKKDKHEGFLSNYLYVDDRSRIFPETFSKQTALKVLSLGCEVVEVFPGPLNCFKCTYLSNSEMLLVIKNLPPSLEKLYLVEALFLEDSFFKLLAKVTPNLNEISLCNTATVRYPSLLKFRFLEDLHIDADNHQEISNLFEYLIKFPALKNVHIDNRTFEKFTETDLEYLRKKFESHGLNLKRTKKPEWPRPANGTLWKVRKAV